MHDSFLSLVWRTTYFSLLIKIWRQWWPGVGPDRLGLVSDLIWLLQNNQEHGNEERTSSSMRFHGELIPHLLWEEALRLLERLGKITDPSEPSSLVFSVSHSQSRSSQQIVVGGAAELRTPPPAFIPARSLSRGPLRVRLCGRASRPPAQQVEKDAVDAHLNKKIDRGHKQHPAVRQRRQHTVQAMRRLVLVFRRHESVGDY